MARYYIGAPTGGIPKSARGTSSKEYGQVSPTGKVEKTPTQISQEYTYARGSSSGGSSGGGSSSRTATKKSTGGSSGNSKSLTQSDKQALAEPITKTKSSTSPKPIPPPKSSRSSSYGDSTVSTRSVPIQYGPHDKSKLYYYDPVAGKVTNKRIPGQSPMTKSQAEYARQEYISKGLSPYQKEGKQLTIEEHRKEWEKYQKEKEFYEKFPYEMQLGGRTVPLTEGMAGKYRALSLAGAIEYTQQGREVWGKETPKVKVYRKGERVTYRVGETTPEKLKDWNVEYVYKGTQK
jgi:hypothetical protein